MERLIAHFESKKAPKIVKALKRIQRTREANYNSTGRHLGSLFLWADTKEGYDFWKDVEEQLNSDGFYI